MSRKQSSFYHNSSKAYRRQSAATQQSTALRIVFLIIGMILLSTVFIPTTLAAGTISGTVYRDYDNDGINDASEPGIAGVVVTGTDDLGNIVSTTTGSTGAYTLPSLAGSDARVEFTLPVSLQFLYPSRQGTNNGTTVQFVDISGGNVTGVDAGFYESSDYCGTTNPEVATTCFITGFYNGSNSSETALIGFPYNAGGHDFTNFTPVAKTASFQGYEVANTLEIGATYGVAYQPTTDIMYVGAYHKRYAGFGPAGPDAIYMLDFSARNKVGTIQLDTLTGTANVAGSDVHDLNIDPSKGVIMDIGSGNVSYAAVGKRSLGDVEISADLQTLYVVNMFNRRIYAIDVSGGTAASASLLGSWATPSNCGGSNHRPMALAWRNGRLWVGSVCENASAAYVHSFVPDPAVASPSFTTELTIPLTFARQAADGAPDFRSDSSAEWNAWIDNPETTRLILLVVTLNYPIHNPCCRILNLMMMI